MQYLRMKCVILLIAATVACSSPASNSAQAPAEVPAQAPAPFPQGELVDLSHAYASDAIFWPTAETFRLEKVADGVTAAG